MNGSNSGNGCGNNAVNGCRNNSVDNNSGRYKGLDSMPVGMTYVPFQQLDELYEPCRGLMEGTMFPELNLVFCGIRGKSR
jgi:hypothetical protein